MAIQAKIAWIPACAGMTKETSIGARHAGPDPVSSQLWRSRKKSENR